MLFLFHLMLYFSLCILSVRIFIFILHAMSSWVVCICCLSPTSLLHFPLTVKLRDTNFHFFHCIRSLSLINQFALPQSIPLPSLFTIIPPPSTAYPLHQINFFYFPASYRSFPLSSLWFHGLVFLNHGLNTNDQNHRNRRRSKKEKKKNEKGNFKKK